MVKKYTLDIELNASLDGRSSVSQRIEFESPTPEFWVFLGMLNDSPEVRKIDVGITAKNETTRTWMRRLDLALVDGTYDKVR